MVFAKVFAHVEQYSGLCRSNTGSRECRQHLPQPIAVEKCRPELRWADLNQDEAETLEKWRRGRRGRPFRAPGRARTGAQNVGKLSPKDV